MNEVAFDARVVCSKARKISKTKSLKCTLLISVVNPTHSTDARYTQCVVFGK